MMVHYSIIIPHKNIPHLLRRCLDSIPSREDIEVIVVDDCSDGIYQEELKSIAENYNQTCRFIFTKEARGAGYARNVGIRQSSGRWLLFADADDYFTSGFVEALDVYRNSNVSIVYFSTRTYAFGKTSIRVPINNRRKLSFTNWEPWGKLFNREYIVTNQFCFEEIEVGNDLMFGIHVAYSAAVFRVDQSILYVHEMREGNLSSLYTKPYKLLRFELYLRLNRFIQSVGADEYCTNWIRHLRQWDDWTLPMLGMYGMLIIKHKQVGWLISAFVSKIKEKLFPPLREECQRRFICKHDKQLIYLNNPKVACSSIKASMFADVDSSHDFHRLIDSTYALLDLTPKVKSYYKFTFVRSPYQRLISCYENKVVQEKDFYLDYHFGFLRGISDFDDFARRIEQIPFTQAELHFQSQYYMIYNQFGKCQVDYVGKIENIKEEYEPIRQRFGLDPLPHINKVASLLGRNWMDYYTLETAELVYSKYKKDFTQFGYQDEYTKLKAYLQSKPVK